MKWDDFWDDLIEMCLPFRRSPMKTVRKWLYRTTFVLGNAGLLVFLQRHSTPIPSASTARLPGSPQWTCSWTAQASPPWPRWWCWWRSANARQRRSTTSTDTSCRQAPGQNSTPRSPLSQGFQLKKVSHSSLEKQNHNRQVADYSVWKYSVGT